MTSNSRKNIDDNDIIARYLADKLSVSERESFEAYYLKYPELLQELNRTAQFKSGLMDLKEAGALELLLKPQQWWQISNRPTLAALLVLAIVGVSSWFHWQGRPQPMLASTVAALTHQFESDLPIAESFAIQRTRTSSYDATISLPISAAAIELRVKPEILSIPALYRVNLVRVSNDNSFTHVAGVNALKSAKDGFVAIYLNTTALTPAIYELRISGDVGTNAAEKESSFLIEVLAARVK